MPRKGVNLLDKRFGRWIVISYAGLGKKGRRWTCRCVCGNEKAVDARFLLSGKSTSCGCRKMEVVRRRSTTHGQSQTGTYKSWANMIRRCHNPGNTAFHHYGGRGIVVCEEWRSDFLAFLAHAGERPSLKHEIERIDNNLGYSPGNVRWATRREQMNNRRGSLRLVAFGESRPYSEWALRHGKKVHVIYSRVRLGWTPERALTEPVGPSSKLTSKDVLSIRALHAEGRNFTELGKLFHVDRTTIRRACSGSEGGLI